MNLGEERLVFIGVKALICYKKPNLHRLTVIKSRINVSYVSVLPYAKTQKKEKIFWLLFSHFAACFLLLIGYIGYIG